MLRARSMPVYLFVATLSSASHAQLRLSAVHEVTDAARGHTAGISVNPECSNMVRVGDDLYFIYRRTEDLKPYVRRFDLRTNLFGPATCVDADAGDIGGAPGYHNAPAILRDGVGRLHALYPWAGQQDESLGTYTIPPRYRQIVDLTDPATWSEPSGLPSIVRNEWGIIFLDIMGVYDEHTQMTHAVGEAGSLGDFGWVDGAAGLGRMYYRIPVGGVPEGPWVLVKAGRAPEDVDCIGNVFTKGDLVLGREPTGPRSLHLVWNIRNTFRHPYACPDLVPPSCDPADCGSPIDNGHQWNYDMYYAVSRDGGLTWMPIDRPDKMVELSEGMQWRDNTFRVYAGDVSQNSERAFDVDNQSRPVLVMMRHRPGTGVMFEDHVDAWPYLDIKPEYDLVWQRWDGTQWLTGVIDDVHDFHGAVPRVRVDSADNIWVFVEGHRFGGGQDLYFTVSTDGGETWPEWSPLGVDASFVERIFSYPDPIEQHRHYLSWVEPGGVLKFVQLSLSCDEVATGEDCNENGVPDQCEFDCNANGVPDDCDVESGASADCNRNGTPDECDVDADPNADCDGDGVPDDCVPCLSSATCPQADVNCDGMVNGIDVASVLDSSNFGHLRCEAAVPRADVDESGAVNGLDFATIVTSQCFGG